MGLTNKEVFQEYHIVGASITSPDYVCLLLEQDVSESSDNEGVKVKFTVYNLEKEKGNRWGSLNFDPGWVQPKVVHTDFKEFLVVDRVGYVYYCGLGKNKQYEKPLNNNGVGVRKLKNIGGTVYGVAVNRSVYKRIGPDYWQLDEKIKAKPGKMSSRLGFDDIDGFSEQDIYAVGSDRDVWHFDGENWTPLDISRRPFTCTCVCCADDGYVYIAGREGKIARGRGDQWQVYHPDHLASDFKSIVSYQGRVFAGTEGKTYLIGEDLVPQVYDFEQQFSPMGGQYLYSAHGKLLLANGSNQVALFDGKKWLNINGCHELTPEESSMLMGQAVDWLEEAQDHLNDIHEILNKAKK